MAHGPGVAIFSKANKDSLIKINWRSATNPVIKMFIGYIHYTVTIESNILKIKQYLNVTIRYAILNLKQLSFYQVFSQQLYWQRNFGTFVFLRVLRKKTPFLQNIFKQLILLLGLPIMLLSIFWTFTAKNTVISPNFPFHKISTPGN